MALGKAQSISTQTFSSSHSPRNPQLQGLHPQVPHPAAGRGLSHEESLLEPSLKPHKSQLPTPTPLPERSHNTLLWGTSVPSPPFIGFLITLLCNDFRIVFTSYPEGLGTAAPKPVCVSGYVGGKCRALGGSEGELVPVVPEGVGGGLLDAHEGLGIQDAVVHVDWVATVLPLSLCLWDQGNTC